jgi:hypothetical protein
MKLVFKTDDINEANEVCALLSESGVPSCVQENSFGNRGFHIPEGNGVWIFVNSQYSDALSLIKDPEFQVTNPIDPNELEGHIQNSEPTVLGDMFRKVLIYGLVFVIIVVVMIVALSGS